jgi:hypothetical protein
MDNVDCVQLASKSRLPYRTDDSVFWDTSALSLSCADPTDGNSGPFVTGVFNRDGPCDGTTNSWAGLIAAAKFTPVG